MGHNCDSPRASIDHSYSYSYHHHHHHAITHRPCCCPRTSNGAAHQNRSHRTPASLALRHQRYLCALVFSTNSSLDATVLPFKVFRQITHRQSGQTTGLHKGKKIAYRQVPAACKLPWNNPSRSFSHRQRENTLTEIGEAKAASSGNPAPEKHALSCAAITIPAKPCAGRTTPTYRRNPAAFAH
jgi:hypothetical protein